MLDAVNAISSHLEGAQTPRSMEHTRSKTTQHLADTGMFLSTDN